MEADLGTGRQEADLSARREEVGQGAGRPHSSVADHFGDAELFGLMLWLAMPMMSRGLQILAVGTSSFMTHINIRS